MNTNNEQIMDVLREIPPLIPQFLRRRRVGVAAPGEIAAELGIERARVFTMLQFDYVSGMYGQVGATVPQLRSYDAYAVFDNIPAEIAELKDAGLVVEDEDGVLTMTARGLDALLRVQMAGIEFVSKRRPLPDEVLERLADDLEMASAVEKSKQLFLSRAGSHLKGYVAGGRYRRGLHVPMVRIEQALLELWGARDDAHVLAW